jgi:enterochelin esterase-like enzyme
MPDHELLTRAKREGTPLLDVAGDHATATFVWQGESAPQLIGDFNGWGWGQDGPAKLAPVAPDLWTHTVRLPRDAYIEYIYTPDYTQGEARLYDPLNRRKVTNGLGKFNNHFTMPDRQHTPLTRVKRGQARGTLTKHTIKHEFIVVGGERDVWLYAPPNTRKAVPLLVVWDGRDYLKRARLVEIVDNLITQGGIQPIALALVDNARHARFVEYHHGEAALMLLHELVLPLARDQLNLIDPAKKRGTWGVLGASMGGLMALYTALRLPHLFGRVISQSGAFQFTLGEADSLAVWMIKHMPRPPGLKIWQDVGVLEWLLENKRAIHKMLQEHHYDVTCREHAGAHNYTSWSDQLPDALMTMFGK